MYIVHGLNFKKLFFAYKRHKTLDKARIQSTHSLVVRDATHKKIGTELCAVIHYMICNIILYKLAYCLHD